MAFSLVYQVLKLFVQAIISIYFRKIHIVGSENVPSEECPIIFCANHSNQFVDALLIGSIIDKELSYTIANSSFTKPVIGNLAKMVKAIPVKRAEDFKIKGKGEIISLKETKLIGNNCNFIEIFEKIGNFEIILDCSKIILNVKNVIDDNMIEINEVNLKNDDFKLPCTYTVLPKQDNSFLFKEAYNIMKNDGSLCIFPEGTSHDQSDLIKLKAGIALIALGAMSQYNTKAVRIVPIGLNYFNREKSRSEVLIEIGKPFEVPFKWSEEYKTNKKVVIDRLLKVIEERLKAVTLTADSLNELKVLHMLRKIYIPKHVKLSPTEFSNVCKNFAIGYKKLLEHPEYKDIVNRIFNYVREIDEIALTDKDISNSNFQAALMKKKFYISFIQFLLYCLLILPGYLIIVPFIIYSKRKAENERIKAKEKNQNKVEALDVVSSVKIFTFIKCLPLILLIWLYFFNWTFKNYFTGLHYYIFEGISSRLFIGMLVFPIYVYCKLIL